MFIFAFNMEARGVCIIFVASLHCSFCHFVGLLSVNFVNFDSKLIN